MDSDVEDDILEDDLLTALKDAWDEELNDDLLRSDEEDVTTSCQEVNILPATDLTSSCDPCGPLKESDFVANEKLLGPQEQVFEIEEDVPSAAIATLRSGVALHLKCEHEDGAPQVAEELRGFTGEQQAGEEPDHGEVLDIQINGPVGDEFQDKPREPVRQQEEDSTTKNRDGESCGLRFKTKRKATATVIRLSSAAGRKRTLTETLELCEEARPALWSHVNKLRRPGRGRGGTQVDTQNAVSIKTPRKMPQYPQTEACSTNQSLVSSLPLWMGGLQSAGVSSQHVPLTSAQSPANPAVDPSSLQDVADCSRLHVQTNQARILTGFAGQHMFHQQHPTSELDSSPVLYGPVPMGAARRPECSGDQGRPHRSPQRSLGLPSPTKTHPASLFVPGGTSLLPASSSTTHTALQEKVPSVPRQCGNQPFPPHQNLLLSLPEPLPVLHPKPQNSQSCASSVQAPPPACLHSLSSESQSSPQSRAAPLCCAVIRPRMQVQISPNCSRALKNPPVLARNSSFINAARPTPTPAAQVRPVARAVATGMPGAARQQASARAGACARTMPERVLAGKSRGQEVKEEPQSPLSLLSKKQSKRAVREERRADEDDKDSLHQSEAGEDDDGDGVSAWYRLQLEKQKRLREKLMSHKEKRRHLQAQYKRRQKQGKLHEVHFMGKIRDGAPQQRPQPSQVSKQAQSTRKPTQKSRPSTSNLRQRQCSFGSESHPNLQLCQQQQHGSALLPPLKPPSKPAYPQTHLAQCSAAAAPVRRAVIWHGQSFYEQSFFGHDDEGSGRFSGELGEWHGRTRKKKVVKEPSSKSRVAKHVRMEEEEDGMSLRLPAQVSEGFRVVTFSQTTFYGPHTLRQVCPNLRRWTASNKLHDKILECEKNLSLVRPAPTA